MAAPGPVRRTVEASTEPAVSGLESAPVATTKEFHWFCANPDHPGLSTFSLKDSNHAIERHFVAPNDPAAEYGGAPVCPACKTSVVAYPIEKEGDIPEAIKKAPY
jgi:hypothetical protein